MAWAGRGRHIWELPKARLHILGVPTPHPLAGRLAWLPASSWLCWASQSPCQGLSKCLRLSGNPGLGAETLGCAMSPFHTGPIPSSYKHTYHLVKLCPCCT